MRLDADSEIEAFSLLITHADPKIFTHMQTPRYSHTCRPQDIHTHADPKIFTDVCMHTQAAAQIMVFS